jgi:hypothetical protein
MQSINWKNANDVLPNTNQTLIVIDSWNICEDDIEGIEEDDGNMTPDFMSIRTAFYNHEKNMW